jgi:hypothetical protein
MCSKSAAVTPLDTSPLCEAREYLLSLKQINYLITRCGLPRADEWCIQIAKVFTAWQTGKLETVDLETAGSFTPFADGPKSAAPFAP